MESTSFLINKVFLVLNKKMLNQYLAKEETVKNEGGTPDVMMGFHASPFSEKIAQHGFYAVQQKTAVRIAATFSKANQTCWGGTVDEQADGCEEHANQSCHVCIRTMLLCRVVLGGVNMISFQQRQLELLEDHTYLKPEEDDLNLYYPNYKVVSENQIYPMYLVEYKVLPGVTDDANKSKQNGSQQLPRSQLDQKVPSTVNLELKEVVKCCISTIRELEFQSRTWSKTARSGVLSALQSFKVNEHMLKTAQSCTSASSPVTSVSSTATSPSTSTSRKSKAGGPEVDANVQKEQFCTVLLRSAKKKMLASSQHIDEPQGGTAKQTKDAQARALTGKPTSNLAPYCSGSLDSVMNLEQLQALHRVHTLLTSHNNNKKLKCTKCICILPYWCLFLHLVWDHDAEAADHDLMSILDHLNYY